MTAGALDDVRVVDDTCTIGGRTATMLLADHGAEVLRLGAPPGTLGPAELTLDRNKVLLAPPGRGAMAELRRLIAAADVYVADAPPGDLERRGLDATTLLSRLPRLVHAWLPPYGTCGRWSQLPPDPLLLAAVAGPSDHYPSTQGQPVAPVIPALAYTQGALGAAATLAALVARQSRGTGRGVAVSGLHAVAAQQLTTMVGGLDVERVFSPAKSLHAGPNFRMYRGSDGRWFYLAALSGSFFIRALESIDRLDVLLLPGVDGEFSNVLIPEIGRQVGAELEQVFASRPSADWLEVLRAADVPVAPVCSRDEWLASEVVAANHLTLQVPHPQLGEIRSPGIAVELSRTPGGVRRLPTLDDRPPSSDHWVDARAPGPVHAQPADRLPLDGVVVLDLSSFLAAPMSSAVLADAGATVIKVESPAGDPYRLFGAAYGAANHSKRSLVLDLRSEDGRKALLQLARHADVMLDNLRPSSLERLGIDEQAIASANPRLVRCSVSAYGRRSASAGEPGFDPVFQALSGFAAAQGGSDDPVASTAPALDSCTGSLAAFGTLLALYERGRSGRGQHVSTSLAAAATFVQSVEITQYVGSPAPLAGGRDFPGPTAGHRLYRVADGWIAVAAITATQVSELLDLLGQSGVPDPADLGAVDARRDSPLAGRIGDALVAWGADAAVDELADRGVPACRVLDRGDELDDGWLAQNDFFRLVRDPVFGRIQAPGGFAHWASPRRLSESSIPVLGQDSCAVLREAGFTDEEVERLVTPATAERTP
jgi:crotonobetainyl-CoA:carnitine CoA-transferase CaiB-like acyl-CoA transferase